MYLRFLLSVAVACPLLAQGVKIQYDPVSTDVVKERLGRNPASNGERAAALHKMFEEAGCTGAMLADQAVEGARQPNVICTFGSETGSIIVIGAHIDFVETGKGAIENWTGASLLPSLFQSLHESSLKHKFVLVGFADRERGRRGSNFYLKSLGADKDKVKAMVNLEGLGLTTTKIQMDGVDKGLSQKMASIAKSLSLKVGGADNILVTDSDERTFRDAKIPVITVHSLYGEARKIPGTFKDSVTAVSMNDYYDSYKLVAAYLSYLDQSLD